MSYYTNKHDSITQEIDAFLASETPSRFDRMDSDEQQEHIDQCLRSTCDHYGYELEAMFETTDGNYGFTDEVDPNDRAKMKKHFESICFYGGY